MNIAVIGTNTISDTFMSAAILHEEFHLAAVCGSSEPKAAVFTAKYGCASAYGDYHELLHHKGLDGVYIAGPNQLHHPMAMFFLEAGIPVLCEKPMAPNLRQVSEMTALAQKNNVLLIEAIVPMFVPNFRQIKKTLPQLGTVRKAVLGFCQYSRRYDSYREGVVLNAFNPKCMGGSLLDIGIYPLYHAMSLFGKPDRVLATANMLDSGVDASGSVLLCYPGMEAAILHSKVGNSCLDNEIQGEDGNIVYNSGSNPKAVRLVSRNGEATDITLPQREERMYYELDEFIRCIKSGEAQSPLAPHSRSLEIYAVTDEIRRQIGLKFDID